MTPETFKAFLDRHNCNLTTMAAALGTTRDVLRPIRDGHTEARLTLRLAMAAVDAGLKPLGDET